MLSNKLWLLPLALMAVGAARPVRVSAPICPAKHEGAALGTVSVYDGPVEENADLVATGSRRIRGGEEATWDVAGVYRAGRMLYATCQYATNAAPLVVPVRQPVKACRLTRTRTEAALTCR